MSAVPKFIPNPSKEVGALLDDLIRYRKCCPPRAQMLRNSTELPWTFRGYVRRMPTLHGERGLGICFLVAEIAEAQSRLFGAAVLDIRLFDPQGLPFPSDLWEQLPDGTWLQSDLPRDTASRRF